MLHQLIKELRDEAAEHINGGRGFTPYGGVVTSPRWPNQPGQNIRLTKDPWENEFTCDFDPITGGVTSCTSR